jgi:hypothetical protein
MAALGGHRELTRSHISATARKLARPLTLPLPTLAWGEGKRRRRAPLSPFLCSDRGQDGRVFGDMVDGFDDVLSQVDLRENVSAIAEVEDAVGVGGA